jgi:hypothetical protein
MRQESLRWQTIWCADIRPQRAALSGRSTLSLWTISAASRALASVFTS